MEDTNQLHQMIDKALGVEDAGCVDFKLLRNVLHSIISKTEVLEKTEETYQPLHKVPIPTATVGNFESLHDSTSRNVIQLLSSEKSTKEEISAIVERISNIEDYVANQTTAVNDLTRVLNTLEMQIFGEVDEIESLKESLDDLRYLVHSKEEIKPSSEKQESNNEFNVESNAESEQKSKSHCEIRNITSLKLESKIEAEFLLKQESKMTLTKGRIFLILNLKCLKVRLKLLRLPQEHHFCPYHHH